LKLRGQDFEAFKLDLKQKIDEYSKYITNKKLLEEYYNRSIQQYLEEQERERKEFINRVVSADIEAINRAVEEKTRKEQEFLEEQRRQQEEWENYYMQSLNKETEIFVKEQMEQLKQFTQISLRKEEVQKALYENFKRYAEDYYSSELDTIQQIKEELGLVQETKLDKLLADVRNLPRKVEDIREGYLSLLKTDFSPLEQNILDIIQAHDEWIKRTGDVELAEKITNATLRQLYSDYAQERINLQQEILNGEKELQERVKELTTDEYDYRIHQLELQADKYREFGLSQLTVEKWLYLEKKRLWEEEVESYREKEERKREIERDARQRYEEFMMKVRGESERLKISGYVSSVQSLIKQLWESLPQSEAIGKITSIISSFNQYVKQQLGEQITQNPQLWEQYIYEGQLALQRYFLQLQQPIKLPEELLKKKPRESEWTNLSDQVKDVTASTQEFWDKVEEVKKKWGEVNKQVASIENTIRDKLISVLGEVEEETRKKINDLIDYMQNLSDDWFRVGESSGSKFGEGFYNGVLAWGNRIGQAIADYIAFKSPPKKGPLSDADKYGYRFILMFLQSMAQATPTMTERIDTFFKPLSPEQLFKRMATKWQPPKDFLELKEFDLFKDYANRVLSPEYQREWTRKAKVIVERLKKQAEEYRREIYHYANVYRQHEKAVNKLQQIATQRPLTTTEQRSLEQHKKAMAWIKKHVDWRNEELADIYKRIEKYERAIQKKHPWFHPITGSQAAESIQKTIKYMTERLKQGDIIKALRSLQGFGALVPSVSQEDLVRMILLVEKNLGKKLPTEFVKLAIPLIQARGGGLGQLVKLPAAQMAGSQIKEYLKKIDFNEIIQQYAKGQPLSRPLAWLASRYGFVLPAERETPGEEIARVSSSYSPTAGRRTTGGIVINIYNNIEKIEGIQDISILKEAVVESVLNALYRLGYS
ncbi:hypothetical protein J7K97_00960, partial [Candidatus Aerophobetes bacterium]|nr:hypothetical protein [Candidatus Aerophobetes bacterium]